MYDDCARQQQFSRRIHPDRVSYQLEVASESDSLNKCSDVCLCVYAYTYMIKNMYEQYFGAL